jgi:hypothetical protein
MFIDSYGMTSGALMRVFVIDVWFFWGKNRVDIFCCCTRRISEMESGETVMISPLWNNRR